MLSALLHSGQSYTKFASHLRNASTRHQDIVKAELMRIRGLLMESGSLSNCETRGILMTLTHIAMLGYELGQTGAFEALGALTSSCVLTRLWAHQIIACLYSHNNDIINFIRPCLQDSMKSAESHEVAAALNTAACMPLPNDPKPLLPLIEQLANPSSNTDCQVRKRALVTLCKYACAYPELFPAGVWAPRLAESLKAETNGNCLLALCAFVESCLRSLQSIAGWEIMFPFAIRKITQLRYARPNESTMYHGVPNPWVQIRLLRLLRLFPMPSQSGILHELERILVAPFSKPEKYPSTIKAQCAATNADQAILLETISLIAYFQAGLSVECQQLAVAILASLISAQSTVAQFVALRGLALMATLPATHEILTQHRHSLARTLQCTDASLLEEGCQLLLALADEDNWAAVVDDIIRVLKRRLLCRPISHEVARRVAILANDMTPSTFQLIGILFKLVASTQSQNLWAELVVLLTGSGAAKRNESVQRSAAAEAYRVLKKRPKSAEMQKFCIYLLGEFGYLLVSDKTQTNSDLIDVTAKFVDEKQPGVADVALTAVAKLTNAACNQVDTKAGLAILKSASLVEDLEMQTRASELFLTLKQRINFADSVLSPMPPYDSDQSLETAKPLVAAGEESDPSVVDDGSDDNSSISDSSSAGEEEKDKEEAGSTIAASSFEDSRSWKDSFAVKNDVKSLWQLGCLVDEGLIYEDDGIRVTFVRRVKSAMAKITIHLQNVSQSITHVKWSRDSSGQCLQVEEANVKSMPIALSPGGSARIDLKIIHVRLALAPSLIRIDRGTDPQAQSTSLVLPIPLSALSFMHPIKTTLQAVREQWVRTPEGEKGGKMKGAIRKNLRDHKQSLQDWMESGLHMQVFRLPNSGSDFALLGTGICETISSRIGLILKTECSGDNLELSVRSSKSAQDFAIMLCAYLFPPARQPSMPMF